MINLASAPQYLAVHCVPHSRCPARTTPFCCAKSAARTTSPTQHVRPPGFCHCWSDLLEQSFGPCPQYELHWSCFQAPAKDISLVSHGASAPLAHSGFANDALYKLTHWHWRSLPYDLMMFLDSGGVAQWLGRRYVAGGLSLIYAWSMVDVWPLCG